MLIQTIEIAYHVTYTRFLIVYLHNGIKKTDAICVVLLFDCPFLILGQEITEINFDVMKRRRMMYVCMYVCMYVRMYVGIYVCMYVGR